MNGYDMIRLIGGISDEMIEAADKKPPSVRRIRYGRMIIAAALISLLVIGAVSVAVWRTGIKKPTPVLPPADTSDTTENTVTDTTGTSATESDTSEASSASGAESASPANTEPGPTDRSGAAYNEPEVTTGYDKSPVPEDAGMPDVSEKAYDTTGPADTGSGDVTTGSDETGRPDDTDDTKQTPDDDRPSTYEYDWGDIIDHGGEDGENSGELLLKKYGLKIRTAVNVIPDGAPGENMLLLVTFVKTGTDTAGFPKMSVSCDLNTVFYRAGNLKLTLKDNSVDPSSATYYCYLPDKGPLMPGDTLGININMVTDEGYGTLRLYTDIPDR